ncbi:MAG: complex I subunit 5 family protein [Lachnospiraceae bacterium]|nr:complex I subunit 5 family protein [Lachnospiraceae bacterium]
MMIAVLVFSPIIISPLFYILGKKNEKLRDNAVIVFTFFILAVAVWQLISAYAILAGAGFGESAANASAIKAMLPKFGTDAANAAAHSSAMQEANASLAAGRSCLDIPGIFAYGLHFTVDGFRAVYSLVTAIMWAGTTLFAKEYFAHEREGLDRYWLFVIMTLGATEGVMLSADLMTSFIFFEILSLTSFTWVIHEETAGAIRAAYTYLFIAVIGGLVLFMGLVLVKDTCGTLAFDELSDAVRTASANPAAAKRIFAGAICILLGFGCKAGMFPVHVWLPKAHPVAPSPASALLSGILTKVGVYGIIMTATQALFGNRQYGLLIFGLGLVTMFLGALLALFSVNLKRTLACSSMSQIGFILAGIGMAVFTNALAEGADLAQPLVRSNIVEMTAHTLLDTQSMGVTAEVLTGTHAAWMSANDALEPLYEEGVAFALSGAMLHMVNHSLLKLVLFMAAGVVVMNLHKLTLDDIRGWGRNKTALKVAFALGALGISGVPLFNGYISKTMLHEGIVVGIELTEELGGMGIINAALRIGEWVFLVSGGFTFAYMLKLFICLFLEKNQDADIQAGYDANASCMNLASAIAILGSSLFMVVLGQPAVMTRLAAFMNRREEILEFSAFVPENLKGGAISLGIGAILYVCVVRRLLMRDGSYVNLWPEWLDLEDLVYRPLLTKWLPDMGGSVARVFGENIILKQVCRFAVFMGTLVGRLLCDSTDALVMLLRRTLLREVPVRGRKSMDPGRLEVLLRDTEEAVTPLFSGFTFALGMTCVGVMLILGVLAYLLLF